MWQPIILADCCNSYDVGALIAQAGLGNHSVTASELELVALLLQCPKC